MRAEHEIVSEAVCETKTKRNTKDNAHRAIINKYIFDISGDKIGPTILPIHLSTFKAGKKAARFRIPPIKKTESQAILDLNATRSNTMYSFSYPHTE